MEIIYILIEIYSYEENIQGKFVPTKLYANQIVKKIQMLFIHLLKKMTYLGDCRSRLSVLKAAKGENIYGEFKFYIF